MNLFSESEPEPFRLRTPCTCGGLEGKITTTGGQDCVRCLACHKFQYNAPKVETGREVRTTTTVHNGIKPKQRYRIIERASGRCELCGARDDVVLHVGHLISVEFGMQRGMTDQEINSEDNLCCMCDQCNLGVGKTPIPLRLAIAMVLARLRNQDKL
jgi:hypothetical protein